MEKEKIQYIDVNLVRELMKSKGIDEKEMAKLMDITLPTIKRFLNGADQRYMNAKILYKLAKIFNTSAESLLHKETKLHKET